MSCCTADPLRPASLYPAMAAPDPKKHVNYVLGMVLGVDDLTQEFTYADNRVRSAVRELIGYGTDRGLAVSLEPTLRGPRARITTGVAYTPSGQMVCVEGDQCCTLNDWLAGHAEDLALKLGAATAGTVRLAITLCYRPCLTDKAPIPGDPCRSEDALMAPSRVKDEFTLDLRFAAPAQTEEDAVRELVRWLRAIPSRTDSPVDSVDDIVAALRAAASPWLALASPVDLDSPVSSPPAFDLGDPPVGLAIPGGDCGEYLRALFRVWVTELRPAWIARFAGACGCGCGCAGDCGCGDADDCVLLAEVAIPVALDSPGVWVVADNVGVVIDETRRPYLLHMRMLQEWLLTNCNCAPGEAAPGLPLSPVVLPDLGGDLSGPIGNGVVETIQGVPIAAGGASEQQVMTFVGGTWRPANPPLVPSTVAGDVTGPLGATVLAAIHGSPVANQAPALDQVLAFDGAAWAPKTLAAAPAPPPVVLAGDVSGAAGATVLNAIRGRPVANQAPTAGQVLGFDGTNWTPQAVVAPPTTIPPLGGDASGQIGAAVVTGLHGTTVDTPTGGDTGSALVYRGANWALERLQPAGDYVQYPGGEKGYAIVAAGRFGFQVQRRAVTVRPFAYGGGGLPERPFNELEYVRDNGVALPWQVEFTFRDYKEWLHRGVLIVKATAGWLFEPKDPFPRKFPEASTRSAFQVMFGEYNEETFTLVVPPGAGQETMQNIVAGEIQIEVGWYPG